MSAEIGRLPPCSEKIAFQAYLIFDGEPVCASQNWAKLSEVLKLSEAVQEMKSNNVLKESLVIFSVEVLIAFASGKCNGEAAPVTTIGKERGLNSILFSIKTSLVLVNQKYTWGTLLQAQMKVFPMTKYIKLL